MEPTQTHDPNELTLSELANFLRQSGLTRRLIQLAYDEDLGESPRDLTGEIMFASDEQARVQMRARESGIVSGMVFLDDLMKVFDPSGQIQWQTKINDGQRIVPGTVFAEFSGNARVIVALERTMLNLVSRLSGIATRTAEFVSLIEGTKAKICDTRKTTPGLRAFEKYAVRCGGGTTHRMGLYDAVLIKDNHLAQVDLQDLATRIEVGAYKTQSEGFRVWFVQVEVDTLEQLRRVLTIQAGVVDIVLLDNMTGDQLVQAVRLRDEMGSGVLLEASGGVSMETCRNIAQSGVDRISVGGLTHQAQSLDIGLDAI